MSRAALSSISCRYGLARRCRGWDISRSEALTFLGIASSPAFVHEFGGQRRGRVVYRGAQAEPLVIDLFATIADL